MERKICQLAHLLLSAAVLAGCSGKDFSDLDEFMAEKRARPGGIIAPIPTFKAYEAFAYSATSMRSPFDRPIEVREIDPQDQLKPQPKSDVNHMWFRAPNAAGQEPWMHHCLMAYASDMSILGSAARRHGVSWLSGQMMGASLDHAMWFHAPLNFDEWHLYTMDSPFAGNARSFNRGSVFTRDGALVASVAQEGLMRPVRKKG